MHEVEPGDRVGTSAMTRRSPREERTRVMCAGSTRATDRRILRRGLRKVEAIVCTNRRSRKCAESDNVRAEPSLWAPSLTGAGQRLATNEWSHEVKVVRHARISA
jgi:hypothetical protein